uniref:Uncharacterized protein n=1 Tax=Nelumbo nucifera TaxID=4432 RepID=A0A822ZDK3_NELNU|nr:TPA_asm: hypothetical protein HUJ06_013991 [Nelumbo nucifera]
MKTPYNLTCQYFCKNLIFSTVIGPVLHVPKHYPVKCLLQFQKRTLPVAQETNRVARITRLMQFWTGNKLNSFFCNSVYSTIDLTGDGNASEVVTIY